MTVHSSFILRLLEMVPDEALRERIKAQYYEDMERQANFVQRRIGDLEINLRDQVAQSLGNTNEMISELLAMGRRQEGAVSELRREFQSIAEKVDDHDREIASFRVSRDQSIAERRQLQQDLSESKADRAAIHQELQEAKGERQSMADTLARIEEMLHGRLSSEEARRLIETLYETVRRVEALEQREQRSNEA